MRIFSILIHITVCLTISNTLSGQNYQLVEDLSYLPDSDGSFSDYQLERCRLDVYHPIDAKAAPVVLWFHGGGLSGGEKHLPEGLEEKGLIVVPVNYRLSPKVNCPAYIEDAASAVAWVFEHISEYGGDPSKIFLSGHSAGGYLVNMVGLDKRWLETHGIDADDLAGLLPLSGQEVTHATVRNERGITGVRPIIDEFAPLYHVRGDAPPMVIITGDRELDEPARYEENAYLVRLLKTAGHQQTVSYELKGKDHGGMVDEAVPIVVKHIQEILEQM